MEGTLINGGLKLRGNREPWIQNNRSSLHLVRRLDLNLAEYLDSDSDPDPDPKLGDSIGELTQLTHLSIYWGKFLGLPHSLISLHNLQHLLLYSCQFHSHSRSHSDPNFKEESKNHLNISHLELFNCECQTNNLPKDILLPNLQQLDIGGCICTDDLIADFCSIVGRSLRHLCIRGCRTNIRNHFSFGGKIPKLPGNLNLIVNLEILSIHSGTYLRYADEFVNNLVVLPQLLLLDLQNTDIKTLPWTVSKMPKLRLLMLPQDFRLENLPYDLNDSLVISVKDTHVRKTWNDLKLELEPSFFPIPMDPTVMEAVQYTSPLLSPHGYLRLRGDPRPWIHGINHDLVQILELESPKYVNSIGDFIGELAGLTHLYISDSSECFHPLPNRLSRLRHLCIQACDLRLFCHSLSKLSTLKSLELTVGTKLPENMDFPVNLSRLSLRCGFMRSLFDSIAKLSNLKTLELYQCSCLTIWPTNLNITKLKLTHCTIGIKSLPTSLRHLEILHFKYSYNAEADYSSFQECLNQLVNLDMLHITCYKLKNLPSIVGLCNLRELQLKDCFSLKELPPSLGELVKLCTINISGTRIKSLPDNIAKLHKLEQLILPKLFRRESLPRYLEEVAILDDTDGAYYKYSCFESSGTDDESNDLTHSCIQGVDEAVSEELEQDLIAQVPKGWSSSMERKSSDFRIEQPSSRNMEQHLDAKRRDHIPAVQLFSSSMSLLTQGQPSDSRKYALHFEGKLPDQLFTLKNIVAEGSAPFKVLLFDAVSGLLIEDGPLSSKKVEIVALHGDFQAEQLEEWTKSDFCHNIITKRGNKRPLLAGECVIALRNGVGLIDDVCFTDNSSWMLNKMFRLGAKMVSEEDQVREAVSTPVRVKDRRAEAYRKHANPSPDDEVWRLCWIAKSGRLHKRLEERDIHKVKDLVTLYHNDQSLLRRTLNVTPKKWSEIIQNATSCFTGNDCTNPSADLAQLQMPIDQQEIQMSKSHVVAGEHMNQLDQFRTFDELLTGSSNTMPSSSATMCSVQTTSWLPEQSMRDEGLRMISSVPVVSASASKITIPGIGLGNMGY